MVRNRTDTEPHMADTLAAYRATALPRDCAPPDPDAPALPSPALFDCRTVRAVFALLSSSALQTIYRAAGEDLHSRALEDIARPAPTPAMAATVAAATPIAAKPAARPASKPARSHPPKPAKPAAKPKPPIRNPGTTRLPKAARAAGSAVRRGVAALADAVGGGAPATA